jgi:hypothetical protein
VWPLVVEPGEQVAVELRFNPTKTALLSGTAVFHSNDIEQPDVSVSLEGDGRLIGPCSFSLNASETAGLQFGAAAPGQQMELRLLARNTGATDCVVLGLSVEGGANNPFSLVNGIDSGTLLAKGATLEGRVLFSPPANASLGAFYSANLVLTVTHPTKPTTKIPLTGTVGQPCLQLSPKQLDFGIAATGCGTRAQTVTLTNTCTSAVTIAGFSELSGHGAFVLAGSAPTSVAALKTATFSVQYAPSSAGFDAAYIAVTTTEAGVSAGAYKISVTGQAQAGYRHSASYSQSGTADILFVIDDSGSMSDKQTALTAALPTFFQTLGAMDYRLAVTTTGTDSDPYCSGAAEKINGQFMPIGVADRIVSPLTIDPASVFARNVNVGTNGCATEQGLDGAYRALTEPNLSGTNSGFLRPGAFLDIIVVTDAEDQSPYGVDFYKDYFTNLKGASNFGVSVIADTDKAVCQTTGVYTEGLGGARYLDITQKTGGIARSICTAENDWPTMLQELATNAYHITKTFKLPKEANANGIVVTLDGLTQTEGTDWTFDLANNAIVFAQEPAVGSSIEVSYAPACY